MGDDGDDQRDDEASSRRCRSPPLDSFSSSGLMTVVGLPSARISASPDATDSVPRVAMKSVILPRDDDQPVDDADRGARQRGAARTAASRPVVEHHPKNTAANVIVEATDRSIPAGGDHERLADGQHDQDRRRDQHRLDVARAQERRVEALEDDRQQDRVRPARPSRPRTTGLCTRAMPGYRASARSSPAGAVAWRSHHLSSSVNGSAYGTERLGGGGQRCSALSLVTSSTGAATFGGQGLSGERRPCMPRHPSDRSRRELRDHRVESSPLLTPRGRPCCRRH